MNRHSIAVIGGDGIGPEVIAEGVKVLQAVAALDGGFAFDFTYYPWGCTYYQQTGRMMAENFWAHKSPYRKKLWLSSELFYRALSCSFDVLGTDEVGGAQPSASRKGRYGERNPSGVSFTSNETGVSRRFPQESVSSKKEKL